MISKLEPIIQQKHREVAALKQLIKQQPDHAIQQILAGKISRQSTKNFAQALQQDSLAVIAEIKRKSPSKGNLAPIESAVVLAQTYVAGGANALSVLTDHTFFGGSLADLTAVTTALQNSPIPVLRKDFIVDEIQIAEAIVAGADAILAIVAVLGKHTKKIVECAHYFGIDVIVEVHNRAELAMAIASQAKIIGVNNRDLTTFHTDTETAIELAAHIPDHIIKIAESGILSPELTQNYRRAGFNAVLIGEALVKSADPATFIRACRHG